MPFSNIGNIINKILLRAEFVATSPAKISKSLHPLCCRGSCVLLLPLRLYLDILKLPPRPSALYQGRRFLAVSVLRVCPALSSILLLHSLSQTINMAPPSAIDIEAARDTEAIVLPYPLSIDEVSARRLKAGRLVAGTAAYTSSDFFKTPVSSAIFRRIPD